MRTPAPDGKSRRELVGDGHVAVGSSSLHATSVPPQASQTESVVLNDAPHVSMV